jgi:hypothetical protein
VAAGVVAEAAVEGAAVVAVLELVEVEVLVAVVVAVVVAVFMVVAAVVRVRLQDARRRCPGRPAAVDPAAVTLAVDRAPIVLRWAICQHRVHDQARVPAGRAELQIVRAAVQHVPGVESRVLAVAHRDPAAGRLRAIVLAADSPVVPRRDNSTTSLILADVRAGPAVGAPARDPPRDPAEDMAARLPAVRSQAVQLARFCMRIKVASSHRHGQAPVTSPIADPVPVELERNCVPVAAKVLDRIDRRLSPARLAAGFNVPQLAPVRMAVEFNGHRLAPDKTAAAFDRIDPVAVAIDRIVPAAAAMTTVCGRIGRDVPVAMIDQAGRGKMAIAFPTGRIVPAKAAPASAGIATIGKTGRTIIGPIGSRTAISGTTGVRITGRRSITTGITIGAITITGSTTTGAIITMSTGTRPASTTGVGPRGRR